MSRGVKLWIGIPIVVIGLFVTLAGGVLTVLVGPDGRFTLPENVAHADGHALLFDALSFRGMRTSGSLSATVHIGVRDQDGADAIFVGVGPRDAVAKYLDGVTVDRLIQVNWPGGVKTETVAGTATNDPAPPADQRFWVASDSGSTASVDWVAGSGDWTIVVMNADGSAPIDIAGAVTIAVPALGPASIALLIVGLALLSVGGWLTVSGARTPRRTAGPRPAAPVAPAQPPARPDATP